MNFTDFYQKGRFRISFEIFPPKTEEGVPPLFEALRDLKRFDPAFVSVTYGAMGTTQHLTRDLAVRIHRELRMTTAFHFTCVGADRGFIREYMTTLKKEGIELIVALRGDPPQGMKHFKRPANGFSYANELVAYLKEIDGFSIAVAGYPEKHIEAPDKETDLKNLARKVAAGADVVITQLYFDNRDYFDFVDRARRIGIACPIIPGIMPIVSFEQIKKITTMCGAHLPPTLLDRLEKNREDHEAVRQIGIEQATRQCLELKKASVPGIHFYILNKSYSTGRILDQLQK